MPKKGKKKTAVPTNSWGEEFKMNGGTTAQEGTFTSHMGKFDGTNRRNVYETDRQMRQMAHYFDYDLWCEMKNSGKLGGAKKTKIIR
mmetsp:Transcript_57856/g.125864  ORF Transcript_57856/g.125864 Transcript_57856/m.125864 type:complete len:87 (+) Transcript_57856:115-375(+)